MALLGGLIGGVRIGNLNGTVSSPFTGSGGVSSSSCASHSGTSAYCGITLVGPKAVANVLVQGSTNNGFTSSGGPTVTLSLYGKTGAAPANATDGTLLGQIAVLDTTSQQTIFSSDNSTTWNYVWVTISVAVSTTLYMGVLEFYEALSLGSAGSAAVLDKNRHYGGDASDNGVMPYEDGYLTVREYDGADVGGSCFANIGKSSGKWYWEAYYFGVGDWGTVGIGTSSSPLSDDLTHSNNSWAYYSGSGNKYHNGGSSYGSSWGSVGDIIGVALDMNLGAIWFHKNGVWQASATAIEIAAGTTTHAAFSTSISGKTIFPGVGAGDSMAPGFAKKRFNLRFDSGAWTYTAPTGFNAVTVAPTTHIRPQSTIVL